MPCIGKKRLESSYIVVGDIGIVPPPHNVGYNVYFFIIAYRVNYIFQLTPVHNCARFSGKFHKCQIKCFINIVKQIILLYGYPLIITFYSTE